MNFEPLKGVRVLDLTSVVVGPACTWRLGQYGAEIIKVEAPEGDLMRGLGGLSPTGQHSGAYLHLNRGKRNVCLDLKKVGAAALMEKLVARSDIIVANMRPRALERLGLDAKTIRAKHPEKIYCLITGYGTDGPYAGRPTYDSVVQGASGMAGLTLVRDGQLVKMEDHPTEGRVAAIRSTIRIDDKYPPRLAPAQPRGAETRVLLHEVGLSASEIDKLISS